MQNGKPCVGEPAPTEPGLGEFCQFRRGGEPLFHGLMTESGLAQPVCPGLGPPSQICRRREAPGARRCLNVVETSCARPAQQPPPGVGFAAVRAGHLVVQLEPPRQFHTQRVPGHCRVIGISYGDETARHADATHLPKGRNRIAEVLQHLMSVNDVKGSGGELQLVDISQLTAVTFRTARSATSAWVAATAAGAASMPTTVPSVSRSAKSIVMVPGPTPISSSRSSDFSQGSRYAAEFAAVRHRCDRRTESW